MKKVYRDFARSALCIWVAILGVTLMHITSAEAACDREGPPGKKALIVANGLYETSSGMNALSGAKNDVTLVRQALEARGFAPSDIVIKQDLGYRDFVKALAAFGTGPGCGACCRGGYCKGCADSQRGCYRRKPVGWPCGCLVVGAGWLVV